MADEELEVEFDGDKGHLEITKKNLKRPGMGRLTPEMWTEKEPNIKQEQVKHVHISKVHIEECCNELFSYIYTCINCTCLTLEHVIDGTQKNNELSCRLYKAVDKLHALLHIHLEKIDLCEGWSQLLSSISHPDLRCLCLIENNLTGQAEELKVALTRLPQLGFLHLDDTGLGGEEMLCVLTQLPSSSPLLQGLLVGSHDLSSGGDQLVQVVEALPQLRILSVEKCQLVSSALCSILEKINTNIEILAINDNGPLSDRKAVVFDHIDKCKSLAFIFVSSNQFSESDMSELKSMLSAHGGRVLIDDDADNDADADAAMNCLDELVSRIKEEIMP